MEPWRCALCSTRAAASGALGACSAARRLARQFTTMSAAYAAETMPHTIQEPAKQQPMIPMVNQPFYTTNTAGFGQQPQGFASDFSGPPHYRSHKLLRTFTCPHEQVCHLHPQPRAQTQFHRVR